MSLYDINRNVKKYSVHLIAHKRIAFFYLLQVDIMLRVLSLLTCHAMTCHFLKLLAVLFQYVFKRCMKVF